MFLSGYPFQEALKGTKRTSNHFGGPDFDPDPWLLFLHNLRKSSSFQDIQKEPVSGRIRAVNTVVLDEEQRSGWMSCDAMRVMLVESPQQIACKMLVKTVAEFPAAHLLELLSPNFQERGATLLHASY